MSAQLGIGVRVWVGWCPDGGTDGMFDGRCKTGTINEGPFMPGELARDRYTGEIKRLKGPLPWWNVSLDAGGEVSASEEILFPIDDGDPAAERERADRGEGVETCQGQ